MRRMLFLLVFLLGFQSIAWVAEDISHFKYQGSVDDTGTSNGN
ncbi:hypothetical protein [Metallumcola ferriviriculae]